MAAVFEWANGASGSTGDLPTDGARRRMRLGAPLSRASTRSPRDPRAARRRRGSAGAPRRRCPSGGRPSIALGAPRGARRSTATAARRVAATIQLLSAAATWQTLRDYWDDGRPRGRRDRGAGHRARARGCRARHRANDPPLHPTRPHRPRGNDHEAPQRRQPRRRHHRGPRPLRRLLHRRVRCRGRVHRDHPAFRHAILRTGADLVAASGRGRRQRCTALRCPAMFDAVTSTTSRSPRVSSDAFADGARPARPAAASDGGIDDLGAFHACGSRIRTACAASSWSSCARSSTASTPRCPWRPPPPDRTGTMHPADVPSDTFVGESPRAFEPT